MVHLSPEPDNYSIPEFRTYVEQAAESSDVRPVEMGGVYVSFEELLRAPVDNSSGLYPDAESSSDDPVFYALLRRRLRGRHTGAQKKHPWHRRS